jgi:hypothetical protein
MVSKEGSWCKRQSWNPKESSCKTEGNEQIFYIMAKKKQTQGKFKTSWMEEQDPRKVV